MNGETVLYALAGHVLADFPLQTDEMAVEKFDSRETRARHVAVHVVSMLPMVLASNWTWRQRVTFLALFAVAHYCIDSKRWVEPKEGFETWPIWYDQSLHLGALALCVAITQRV